jgi:hypothetical protein
MANKFKKAENPYAVRKGQIWRSKDPRRKNRKFTVNKVFLFNGEPSAEVEYPESKKVSGSIRRIRLDRFKKYQKISDQA